MRRLAALVLLLAVPACAPVLDGFQLTKLPPGLGYVAQARGAHGSAAGHRAVDGRFWATVAEPSASLAIVQWEGAFTRSDLDAWIEEVDRGRTAERTIENVRIDGRPAWLWLEGGGGYRVASAVVTYPDATFTIRLASGRPDHQDERLLRGALMSFDRDPGAAMRWMVPVAALGLVALAIVAVLKLKAPPPPPRVVSRPAPPPPSPLSRPPGAGPSGPRSGPGG